MYVVGLCKDPGSILWHVPDSQIPVRRYNLHYPLLYEEPGTTIELGPTDAGAFQSAIDSVQHGRFSPRTLQ